MSVPEREHIIAGNWKMYKTSEEAVQFLQELFPLLNNKNSTAIYLAVPFTAIKPVSDIANFIVVGAQNMNDAAEGAFTGEIAARMLVEEGAKFVILGHSERRRYFHESNEFINRKVKRAFLDGLQPLLCIGETLAEREEERTQTILEEQLNQCLDGLNAAQIGSMIIAYEPVWAIGNHHSATLEQVQDTQKLCRDLIAQKWGPHTAKQVRILYGGSVNAGNIKQFMNQPDIDGVLVGGASLAPQTFAEIINYGRG